MKNKFLKLTASVALCTVLTVGMYGCGEQNPPETPPEEEKKTFSLSSNLEFFNWNDARDLVISYEGEPADSVSIAGTPLNASDYTAENGKLTISKDKLDTYAEGKYELKAAAQGVGSDTLVLFVGEQIQNGSRYVRRQADRGEDVTFYFDAQNNAVSSLTCDGNAVESSLYGYEAEDYLFTVKGNYLDSLTAGIHSFEVKAGSVAESFDVLAYGGKGHASSAVFGADFTNTDEKKVSLPLDLFAENTPYSVSGDGLILNNAPVLLESKVELDSDTVYCLKFSAKISAAYLTVAVGDTEIVSLDKEGILSRADERTTDVVSENGVHSVCAYFNAASGNLCFRKGATDEKSVALANICLLKTKIVDVGNLELGTCDYKKGTNKDITIELPFDGKIITSVKFADSVLDKTNYTSDGYKLVIKGSCLESQMEIGGQKDLKISYDIVKDEAGTLAPEPGVAKLTVKGVKMDAPKGSALTVWEAGKDVSVKLQSEGKITEVKLNDVALDKNAYSYADGTLTVAKTCFEDLEGVATKIEISNQGGSFTCYAQKGEFIFGVDAETGSFDNAQCSFFNAPTNSEIVSGANALNGNYSYKRSGPNDTWNNIFVTHAAGKLFVEDDYYMISFRIKPQRNRPDSDASFDEIRTYFNIPASLSEITHKGKIKKDDNARANGGAGVYMNEDGSLDIAVTLPAKSQELTIAFCFEGSAIFDDIAIYHLAN